MLRLQAFAEGFFIYNTNKQVKVGGEGGGGLRTRFLSKK